MNQCVRTASDPISRCLQEIVKEIRPNQACILPSRHGATLLKLSHHLPCAEKQEKDSSLTSGKKMPEGFILMYESPSRHVKYYKV